MEGPQFTTAHLVGQWESDSTTEFGTCLNSSLCCKKLSVRSSFTFQDKGSVAEVRWYGSWIGSWTFYILDLKAWPISDGVVWLRNATAWEEGLPYGNRTGQGCFSAFPVMPGDGGEPLELVIMYSLAFTGTFHRVRGYLVGVRSLCDASAGIIDLSSCSYDAESVPKFKILEGELDGQPPFFGGRVMMFSTVLRRVLPSAAVSNTSAALPYPAAERNTEGAAQPWTGTALPALLGSAAAVVCLVAIAVAWRLCRWQRALVGSRTESMAPVEPQVIPPLGDLSEQCLNEELPIQDFARKRHVLLPSSAVHCSEMSSDAAAAAGGLTRQGLLHGTTQVGLKDASVTSPEARAAAIREIRIWQRARHQNVVLFHGIIVESQTVQIVLEWIRGCSTLGAYVSDRRGSGAFAQQAASTAMVHEHRLLIDVARAMQHLHSMHPAVFHRGLRPACIFVEAVKPPRAKVSDFSASCIATEPRAAVPETLIMDEGWRGCAAPELLDGQTGGASADVYAFGRVALFTVTADSAVACDDVNGLDGLGSLVHVLASVRLCLECLPGDRPGFERVYWDLSEAKAVDREQQL